MLQEIKEEVQSSIAPLIQGILGDAQHLMAQELALARSEITQEITKAKTAAISLGAGIGLMAIAAILFCLTVVQFLLWAFPELPIWMSYALVTALAAVSALAFISVGKKKASEVSPVPRETIDSIKENAEWLKQKI